jgi:hypothetical protein
MFFFFWGFLLEGFACEWAKVPFNSQSIFGEDLGGVLCSHKKYFVMKHGDSCDMDCMCSRVIMLRGVGHSGNKQLHQVESRGCFKGFLYSA